jgi:hypothetical protein
MLVHGVHVGRRVQIASEQILTAHANTRETPVSCHAPRCPPLRSLQAPGVSRGLPNLGANLAAGKGRGMDIHVRGPATHGPDHLGKLSRGNTLSGQTPP